MMQYNKLGKAGIKLSEISFGSWITFGKQIGFPEARECMHYAFDQGVNFFDNAEAYAGGEAERIMGEIIKDFRREDLVISTKIFWGGKGPNDLGVSRKRIFEGTRNSLKRLQLDYVDLLFCHRPDPTTPIEETVLAMDYVIRQGYALYWGTSEWSAIDFSYAYDIAKQLHCIPPSMEQPQYNMLHRARVEKEYQPLYERYGMGTTIWSPLASGLLTGKYNQGIPTESRLAREPHLKKENMVAIIKKVEALTKIAQELGCTNAQLAIAWCLTNPHVSSVITGASRLEQVKENLAAATVKTKLTPEVLAKIEAILNNDLV